MKLILTSSRGRRVESTFESHEAAATALAKKLDTMPQGKDRGFAESLVRAFQLNRSSNDQLVWTHILAMGDDALGRTSDVTIDFTKLAMLMSTAQAHALKFPKIRAAGMAVAVGKYTGLITAFRIPGWRVLGEVPKGGTALICKSGITEQELALLRELAEDPIKQAKLYGDRTGNCCFCGLGLTTAESVGSGYGPICAAKWGLPWANSDGAKLEKRIREALRLQKQMDDLKARLELEGGYK